LISGYMKGIRDSGALFWVSALEKVREVKGDEL
jgi:hypothetical protein